MHNIFCLGTGLFTLWLCIVHETSQYNWAKRSVLIYVLYRVYILLFTWLLHLLLIAIYSTYRVYLLHFTRLLCLLQIAMHVTFNYAYRVYILRFTRLLCLLIITCIFQLYIQGLHFTFYPTTPSMDCQVYNAQHVRMGGMDNLTVWLTGFTFYLLPIGLFYFVTC